MEQTTIPSTPPKIRLPRPKPEEIIKNVKVEIDDGNEAEEIGNFFQSQSPRTSLLDNRELYNLMRSFNYNVISMRDLIRRTKWYVSKIEKNEEIQLLRLAIECIDLTTLAGDDTVSNVERLCFRAHQPIPPSDDSDTENFESDFGNKPDDSSEIKKNKAMFDDEFEPADFDLKGTNNNYTESELKCAAVCVYPARVSDCHNTLAKLRRDPADRVRIASVATGFPSGQYSLKSRLAEIQFAIEQGANEIDVVINRPAAIAHDWVTVYNELCEMRGICHANNLNQQDDYAIANDIDDILLKVIIGAGDLLVSSPKTIYTASLVSILAGADFIKTSTGKESVNATLSIGLIMMRCILDYYLATGILIGFKPAGGIRTYRDALNWLVLVRKFLGVQWLTPKLFRLGASGLLDSIVKRLQQIDSDKNQVIDLHNKSQLQQQLSFFSSQPLCEKFEKQ